MIKKEWFELPDPRLDFDYFDQVLEAKVNILDVCDKQQIDYAKTYNGNFTHRLRCPFPCHNEGNERTASNFIDAKNNSFKCYGCNFGGSVIDFVSRLFNMPYFEAQKWLSDFAKITDLNDIDFVPDINRARHNPEKTPEYQSLKISNLIRRFLLDKKHTAEYIKLVEKANSTFRRLDKMLSKADVKWEEIRDEYNKIKGRIEARMKGK